MTGTSTTFRAPRPPRPVEKFDLAHPLVGRGLEGLTILHVSDLHVRRSLLRTERYRVILDALDRTPADVIAITGDLMDEPGHEEGALETLLAMAGAWRPRMGVFGVFGNHDTPEFRRACARELPGINWIGGRAVDVPVGSVGPGGGMLRLMGLDWPEDPLAVGLVSGAAPEGALTIALAHHPNVLIPAAAMGIPIVLAGHTHAGQVRLHRRLSPHTSSDLPVHLASGILQLGSTLCCISRGLGDGVVEHLRVNCPRQMPLYTLRRGEGAAAAETARQVRSW